MIVKNWSGVTVAYLVFRNSLVYTTPVSLMVGVLSTKDKYVNPTSGAICIDETARPATLEDFEFYQVKPPSSEFRVEAGRGDEWWNRLYQADIANVQQAEECHACNGDGKIHMGHGDEYITCWNCDGSGVEPDVTGACCQS